MAKKQWKALAVISHHKHMDVTAETRPRFQREERQAQGLGGVWSQDSSCWWECHVVPGLGETTGQLLKEKTVFSLGPSFPAPGRSPKKMKSISIEAAGERRSSFSRVGS